MGRKSAKELIKRIIKSISENPKSIHEIAQESESNWESIKMYLESLKDAGVVNETLDGNKRMFSLVDSNVLNRNGNYFNLPIKPEDEKLINSLFAKVREDWKTATERHPGKTQVQKTLVKVDQICNLKLPIGWYLFGAMCVKPYEPFESYSFNGLEQDTEKCVRYVVGEYSKESSVYRLKIRQYNEENKILYQTKEIILSLLSSKVSKEHINEINRQLYVLLANLPPICDNDSKELINEFTGVVFQLLSTLPEEDMQFVKNDIYGAFNEVWKLIALYGFSTDLEPYYSQHYSKQMLLKHFNADMCMQKLEVRNYLSYLNDLIPQIAEPEDETYQKLKHLFASAKKLSPEEKTQREKELEKIRKDEGEAGVQEFLLKEFNLN
ncbi:MAG: helix-turn-helix transcriptional regulator [Candidatus Aenigmarchaeota archaeon]|nr:helix-turn-helix transcriptional regulator [Candidatus Aenigmarchaeota archaeon]